MAVYGFFGISGYLIARSAETHGVLRFVWLRAVRIFPGFWVALVMTAYVFGPLVWLIVHHGTPRAGLGHYFSPPPHNWLPPNSPFSYVWNNWWLQIQQIWISGIIRNSSLWTLYFEFICYLILAAMALIGLLRRRLLVVALTAVIFAAVAAISLIPAWNRHFNVYLNWVPMNILKFLAVFLVGTLLYLYRESVPDSGWLALGCSVVAYGSLWLTPSIDRFALHVTITDVFIPAMVYPVLWLGAHLPGRSIGVPNDYSYGLYIYAFPVAQLLALWGAYRWGYAAYVGLTFLVTATLAVTSWWLIEQRFLRLKDLGRSSSRHSDPRPSG